MEPDDPGLDVKGVRGLLISSPAALVEGRPSMLDGRGISADSRFLVFEPELDGVGDLGTDSARRGVGGCRCERVGVWGAVRGVSECSARR
jgi:hypothetical protein